MIPHPFTYAAPRSVAEAIVLLARAPQHTQLLGGGTWVVPELHLGLRAPRAVIDLRRAGLGGISQENGPDNDVSVTVGATTTYAELLASPVVAAELPLLARMAAAVTGGAALHNQATIGGSLCAARPSSDALGAVVASGGTALVDGCDGRRELPAADMVRGVGETTLEPGELLVGLRFPSHAGARSGYRKVKRGTSGWPLVTASVLVRLDHDHAARTVAVTIAGLGAVPLAVPTGALLGLDVRGEEWVAAVDAAVARALDTVTEPYTDEQAGGAYRLAIAPVAARRAVIDALDPARAWGDHL